MTSSGPSKNTRSNYFVLSFKINQAKIRILTATDWPSSVSGWQVMVKLLKTLEFHLNQRRIFIFEAQGYFTLEALLESLRSLMSYKLALHAFVTFTEEVVPIQKHISYFTLNSHDIRSKNSHNKTNEMAAVKLPDHTPIAYLLSTSLVSCMLKNGFRRFVPLIIRSNNQFSTSLKREC